VKSETLKVCTDCRTPIIYDSNGYHWCLCNAAKIKAEAVEYQEGQQDSKGSTHTDDSS
jgi:hypothetical protein